MRLVSIQYQVKSPLGHIPLPVQELLPARRIAEGNVHRAVVRQSKTFSERLLPHSFAAVTGLLGVPAGNSYPASRRSVLVVINNQRAFITQAVRVREDVLIYPAVVGVEIVEQ